MGKAPTITWEKKIKKLKKFGIFNSDGSLKKESHPVWKEVHDQLNAIEKKSIYLDVFNDRKDIKTILLNYFTRKGLVKSQIRKTKQVSRKNITSVSRDYEEVGSYNTDKHSSDIAKLEAFIELQHSVKSLEQDNSYGDSVDDPLECEDKIDDNSLETTEIIKNPQNFHPINFKIHLDEEEWRLIKPKNGILPPNQWADVIAINIIDNTAIRCAYMFKVGKVYRSLTDKYIDFYAFCKQNNCKTFMYGVCTKKPSKDEEGIDFDIFTYDTTSLFHSTKRPFRGTRRKKAGEKLVYMTAERLKHEMVHEKMNFSEIEERPDIPSGANLRTVKAEGFRKFLGISGPTDPVKSLLFLMDEFNFIKSVYISPFRAWYYFDQQIDLWNLLAPLNPVIKLDATGSLVKKTIINEESSAYIYLYQLLTTVDNAYAPLFQMISSRHDSNVINQWLTEWKSLVKILPAEAICDDGLALLYSLSETLNDCTWKFYLSACLRILQGYKGIPRLKCKIGLDRAHITKTPSRWKSVQQKNSQDFKDFITRSIALAVICETLEDVRKNFLATFIICLSETRETGSVCEEKYENFLRQCETFGIGSPNNCDDNVHCNNNNKKDDVDAELINNESNSEAEINLHMHSNDVKDYVQSIHDEAVKIVNAEKTTVTDENLNEHYCPDVISNLLFLYCQFPAWTMVMLKYFGSTNKVATSADLEAYFKDLRNTHNLHNVLSANTFVMYHARIIDAQMKIAKLKAMKISKEQDRDILQKEISKAEKEISSIVYEIQQISSNSLDETVNKINCSETGNKVSPKIKTDVKVIQKVQSYDEVVQCTTINPNKGKYHTHLRNGHLDAPVSVGKKEVIFGNTCAYDSGFAIFSFAYETNSIFKSYIDENRKENGLFFQSIVGYSNRIMDMETFYANRGLLLLDFQSEKTSTYYNCECNINTLLSSLMRNQMSCSKVVRCDNNKCRHSRLEKYRILIVNDVTAKHLIEAGEENLIHECISNLFDEELLYCRKCRNEESTAHGTMSLGQFLAVDISKVFEDYEIPSTNVPTHLIVQGLKLTLAGFVVRIPPKEEGLAHYVAYCYHTKEAVYEMKDDLLHSSKFTKHLPPNLKISTMLYVIAEDKNNLLVRCAANDTTVAKR